MAQAQILLGEAEFVRTKAMDMAKGLNCFADNTPCGQCPSCKVFDSGNHPDTIFVKGTKQSGIGVDDVREQIVLPMSTKPFKYKYKIFIIEKAETLTPAAQNALLKTIEEPAPYGVFLFLAPHAHNFLATVISRCSIVKLNKKQEINPTDKTLLTLASEIADNIHNMDTLETFMLYRKFEPYKDSKETLQELLSLLYIKFGEKISTAINRGQEPPISFLNATKAITKTRKILSQNGNTQLAIELMLVKMK